jgi:Tat protein secretion system quality control protein TatD with DNase activity
LEYSLQLQQAIKSAPIEKILVETDSPVRYKTSDGNYYSAQPKDVIKTLKFLSKIKELPFDEVVAITTNNAKEFFKI